MEELVSEYDAWYRDAEFDCIKTTVKTLNWSACVHRDAEHRRAESEY